VENQNKPKQTPPKDGSKLSWSRRGRLKKVKKKRAAERRVRHGRREPEPPRGRPLVPRPPIRRRVRPKGSFARLLYSLDLARSVTQQLI
jgi:hypothetical protein